MVARVYAHEVPSVTKASATGCEQQSHHKKSEWSDLICVISSAVPYLVCRARKRAHRRMDPCKAHTHTHTHTHMLMLVQDTHPRVTQCTPPDHTHSGQYKECAMGLRTAEWHTLEPKILAICTSAAFGSSCLDMATFESVGVLCSVWKCVWMDGWTGQDMNEHSSDVRDKAREGADGTH